MLIDWFTVAAQTLNFLILAWLLKRFLYQPILDAIDAREKRIADELADAAAKQQQAQQQRDDFEKKNNDFDQQRDHLMQQATAAGEAEHQRLLSAARQAADALSEQRAVALQRQQHGLLQQLSEQTRHQVFAIARKTLADLSDKTLESAVTNMLIKKLNSLADDEKSRFADSIHQAQDTVCIHSTFALTDTEQAALQQAINRCFSLTATLTFDTTDNNITGIALSANGQRIDWTIDGYLSALEQNIAQTLMPTTAPPDAAAVSEKTPEQEPAT